MSVTQQTRFNPPPGWPPVPTGWQPPPNWQPDDSWPAAPSGWPFQIPVPRKPWVARHKFLTTVIGLLAGFTIIGIVAGLTSSPEPANSVGAAAPPASAAAKGSAAPKASAAAAKAKPKGAGFGKPVRDGKFEFTVTGVKAGVPRVGPAEFGLDAQGQFVEVFVTVKNIGNEARTLDSSSQKLFDTAGREYSASGEASIYLDKSNSFLNEINPGNTVKAILVYDVPKTFKANKIELHDSFFSGGVDVRLAK